MRSATSRPSVTKATEEDIALFRAAVANATPVEDPRHPAAHQRPKPPPIPRQRIADEARALDESRLSDVTPETLLDSDERLSFARNGISSDTLRRLRKGHWTIQEIGRAHV